MGRGGGGGAGRGSRGRAGTTKLGTRFVDVDELAGALDSMTNQPIGGGGPGESQIRVDTQKRLFRQGRAGENTVKIGVTPSGKLIVDDGRHRILAARDPEFAGKVKLKVQFRRAREPK